MTEATSAAGATPSPFAGSDWFDPLEEAVRLQVRGFIEELLEEELEAALGRGRYERSSAGKGHRHGRRTRQLVTTFGPSCGTATPLGGCSASETTRIASATEPTMTCSSATAWRSASSAPWWMKSASRSSGICPSPGVSARWSRVSWPPCGRISWLDPSPTAWRLALAIVRRDDLWPACGWSALVTSDELVDASDLACTKSTHYHDGSVARTLPPRPSGAARQRGQLDEIKQAHAQGTGPTRSR